MSFSMQVVNEEEIKAVIEEQVKPVPEELMKLKATADANVAMIMELDTVSKETYEKRKEILQSIESFGLQTMKSSSNKNSLLKVSLGQLAKSGDEGGQVAKGLSELQVQLKDLDPSAINFAKSGFLGKLFNPIRSYFQRFEKADVAIADIVMSLDKGKKILENDNTTLEHEQLSLRMLSKTLEKEIQLGTLMDESIENQIEKAKIEGEDQEKIKFISEEVLYPLRQRVMDLQQMLVVNHQGDMSYEVVIRNNRELIRGVERAKTVTISALNTAVTVASALYNQKIVLQKITALNQTTNTIIEGTSRLLKEQGVAIQKQAMESAVSVETLKTSFTNVISAFESISTFKQEALPKMRQTILQFQELAEVGSRQIQRLEKGDRIGL
ncbi:MULTISPECIES: toxic anion resistance protein [Bacillaceae]|uniref:toxic anion resistance protein n=1 Tax=Bacillaceae TaxID=186817 RepID=UPI000BEE6E67|nr:MULTISPECIES: toxic anion resistance protein [unclassified Bacillus (in: firmicutes)]PEC49131.1 toxic anion resistance protein [Bacillus sp. AFS096315]PFM75452.1 toxic anion resistance protein [Bacillus sp. AFS077874]